MRRLVLMLVSLVFEASLLLPGALTCAPNQQNLGTPYYQNDNCTPPWPYNDYCAFTKNQPSTIVGLARQTTSLSRPMGEEVIREDDYFVSRKLYPNVDFYSGIIYQAMNFPVDMFPVLFAIPRTSGWLAQWEEMLLDKEQKIARPRQVYLGYDERDYQPIEERQDPEGKAQLPSDRHNTS